MRRIGETYCSGNKRAIIKETVLTHYGNGKCACVKCGYSDIRALSIDHVNGGGCEERRLTHRAGNTFYRWLVTNEFPMGYQTLCMNCQWIKRFDELNFTGITMEHVKSEYKRAFPR